MQTPIFQEGTKVRFLAGYDEHDYFMPVWDFGMFNTDLTNVVWTVGIVEKVYDDLEMRIQCSHNDKKYYWLWPMPGHVDWDNTREGWIHHHIEVTTPQCTCSLSALMIMGCTCGAMQEERNSVEGKIKKHSDYI